MSSAMRISLRAGERFFVNGAVIRASRKTTIELMNDATFLLESHVLQPEQATTPLRQLYFALQTLLIDPASADAVEVYRQIFAATRESFITLEVVEGLQRVGELVDEGKTFDALKTIRGLYPTEERILDSAAPEKTQAVAA